MMLMDINDNGDTSKNNNNDNNIDEFFRNQHNNGNKTESLFDNTVPIWQEIDDVAARSKVAAAFRTIRNAKKQR